MYLQRLFRVDALLRLTPTEPAFRSTIDLDWWQPHRDAAFSDFEARVAEEIREVRRVDKSVRVRRFRISDLPAVEIRSISRTKRVQVQTLIGVPYSYEMSELFVVFFVFFGDANSQQEKRDEAVYEQLVRSLEIRPLPAPPN